MTLDRIVVEGRGHTASLTAERLATAGYDVHVVESLHAALRRVLHRWPDMVVVCVESDHDGLTVVAEIRASFPGPILVVGPTRAPELAVRILDAGADDYVSHHVPSSELLARVRARLRHAGRLRDAVAPDDATSPGLHLDEQHLTVSYAGRRAHLSPREMAILRLLALDAGRIVEIGYLVAEVWGIWGPSEETILRTYIKFLRRKLDYLVGGQPVIASVRGRGYRLDLPLDLPPDRPDEAVPSAADSTAIRPRTTAAPQQPAVSP